ncbi:MAG: lycopene cyclase domain-containing protein [Flavobacterium sp.]|nr:lycopene cyclase domain-containing protein [Pedobacter sp.]
MKLTYLLINFLTILFPLILSFDSRVKFYKKWKFIFPGLFISGFIFLIWDYVFTITDVWSFNPDYVTGIWFLNLPLEEILFFITVPFACIFIYECLNYYVKKDVFKPFVTLLNYAILVLSVVMIVVFYDRVYTLVTFGLLFSIIFYAGFISKFSYLSRFYLAYFVSLIPFLLVNGILTCIPVVLYNNAENADTRVGTIPIEDFFYSLSLILMNVLFFEYFKGRNNRKVA